MSRGVRLFLSFAKKTPANSAAKARPMNDSMSESMLAKCVCGIKLPYPIVDSVCTEK